MSRIPVLICVITVMSMAATHARSEDSGKPDISALLVKAQKICPVSGRDLDSMGGPVRADISGATMFLCCKECFGKPLDKTHWAKAKANLAAAQELCPIFKKPLGQNPTSVVVENRLVFVCCPPCVAKVKGDAKAAIDFVDKQLAKNLDRGDSQ